MLAKANQPAIDVALATFNGAPYLPALLESMRLQDWADLRIVACDDGSHDNTVALLRETAELNVDLTINPANLGPRGNFSKALQLTTADYVVLADQDDIWLPGKLDLLMTKMRAIEDRHGPEWPIVVFSDLRIVDEHLAPLADSFFDGTFKSRDASQVQDFAISNHVPGCVMMVNRALIDLALPVPPEIFMHDWWLCLVAAGCGTVGHVEQPLILFRRHGANFTGDGRAKLRGDWFHKTLRRAQRPMEKLTNHWKWIGDKALNTNRRLSLLDQRCRDRLLPQAYRQIQALRSDNPVRRIATLRYARLGESWHDAALIALLMGGKARRDVGGALTSWG